MPTELEIQNAFTQGIDNLDSLFAPGWTESAKEAFGGDEAYKENASRMAVAMHISRMGGYDPREVVSNFESYAGVSGLSSDPLTAYASLQSHYGFVEQQQKEVGQFEGFINSFRKSGQSAKQAFNAINLLSQTERDEDQVRSAIARLEGRLEDDISDQARSHIEGQISRWEKQLEKIPKARAKSVEGIVEAQADIAKLGVSTAFKEFLEAEGLGASLGEAITDPVEVVFNILASSSVQMLPAVLGTMTAGPLGGGAATFPTEFSHTFVEAMQRDGVNLENPDEVSDFISDQKRLDKAIDSAIKKASVVSLFQVGGGALAGKVNPRFSNAKVGAIMEGSVQIGEEVGGEALGQLFAFGEIDSKEVLMELIASGPNTVTEFVRNARSADGKVEITEAFENLATDEKGRPLTLGEFAAMGSKTDGSGLGMAPIEEAAFSAAASGSAEAAQGIQSLIIEKNKEVIHDEFRAEPTEIESDRSEIKLLTEGIKSVETEIEANLDVTEPEVDVPLRTGDARDPDDALTVQARRREEAESKKQAELEKEFQAELEEINDWLEITSEVATPETKPDLGELKPSEEKTVSDILNHLAGSSEFGTLTGRQGKELSPKRLAVLRERVRGDKRLAKEVEKGAKKLKAQKEASKKKLDQAVFRQKEKIANLEEKLIQQKNDLSLKAKVAAKKVSKRNTARIKKIRQDEKAKRITQTEALKDQAGSVRAAIRQVEEIVNAMPAEVQKKFKGIGTLAEAKSLPVLEKRLRESIVKLNNLFEAEVQKVLVKDINKTVKKINKAVEDAKKGPGGKPFKYGKDSIRYTELAGFNGGEARKVAQQRFDDLNERIASAPDDKPYEMTESDFEIQREGMIPNVAEGQFVDNSLLGRYLEDLKSVVKTGLSEHNKAKADRRKKIESKAKILKTSTESRNQDRKKNKLSKDDTARERSIWDLLRKGNSELLDTRSVSTILTGKRRNQYDKLVFEPISQGVSESILAHQEYTQFVRDKAKDLGLNLEKSGSVPLGQVGNRQMSMYEGMFVYGHSQNPLGLEHLKATKFGGVKLRGEIDGIIDALPKEHKSFVDALIDYNDDIMYPKLDKLYQSLYGIPMPKEDRYLPLMNLSSRTAFDHTLKENPAFMRIHTSFLKARSESKLGFDSLDLIGSLEAHNSSAEHAVHLHETLTDANQLFSDQELQQAMQESFPESVSYVKDYVTNVARGELMNPKSWVDRIMRWMRNNTRTYFLALNPGSWTKTQAPMLSALQSIDKGAAASAAQRHLSKSNWKLASSKSPFMKTRPHTNRIEVMEFATRQFQAGALGKVKGAVAKAKQLNAIIQDKAYWVYTPLDMAASSTAWVAKYTEQINKGSSESDAVLAADDIVKRFFPSGRVDELPPLFQDQGLKKELTIFTADMNRMWNLGYSTTQLKSQKVQEGILFAFYSVFLSAAYLALTDAVQDQFREAIGLKEEDEDRGKTFLSDMARYSASQSVGGIPVLGKVTESQIAAITGNEKFSQLMSRQTPIFLYPASQVMQQNYGTAAFSLFGLPGSNLIAPTIDDYIDNASGGGDIQRF